MDVDIDFRTDFDPQKIFPEAIRASRIQDKEIKPHNAGVYFQHIAKDCITRLAAIPYQEAEESGYFKIDFLHLSLLDNFENKTEIRTLLKREPDWLLLQNPAVVGKLFQLHSHFELVHSIKPSSVQELADCIALIRPGKRYLLDAYIKDRNVIRKELYTKPDDDRPYYKKSHAIAYALTITLQLHLIKSGIL